MADRSFDQPIADAVAIASTAPAIHKVIIESLEQEIKRLPVLVSLIIKRTAYEALGVRDRNGTLEVLDGQHSIKNFVNAQTRTLAEQAVNNILAEIIPELTLDHKVKAAIIQEFRKNYEQAVRNRMREAAWKAGHEAANSIVNSTVQGLISPIVKDMLTAGDITDPAQDRIGHVVATISAANTITQSVSDIPSSQCLTRPLL